MYCVIYLEHWVKARVYLLFLKKIKKGSRLVVVNNGLKHPYAQINYGSGKDVSNETVKNDANEPLIIKWFSDSYIKIPIKR